GEPPHQVAVDRPEGELAPLGPLARAGYVLEEPLELRAGEVRIENEAGLLANPGLAARGAELFAARGRASVLPDDGAMHGGAGLAVPEDRRLALVGDADGRDGLAVQARRGERALDADAHRAEDFLGIVLDPAGLRIMLRKLALVPAQNPPVEIHDEDGRAGRALVDGEQVAHG